MNLFLIELMKASAKRYEFRARRAHEDEAQYLAALIDHVESRDFAEGHELRVGKPQRDWSAADVADFHRRMTAQPPTRDEFRPGVHTFPMFAGRPGEFPADEATLLDLAGKGLDAVVGMRRLHPTRSLAIFANVLLTNGALLTTTVGRADRFALLKMLARTQPVFGFYIVFDAFAHRITEAMDGRAASATKQDTILVQIGTRDLRVMKSRPYRVVDDVAVFDDPPPPDVDKRDVQGTFEDPYASIFVSVPMPDRATIVTTSRQFGDHEGDFHAWQDHPQPCTRQSKQPTDCRAHPGDGDSARRELCGAKVQVRQWDSHDGGYEDFQYRCAAGHTWWIDGIDS